MSPMFPLQHKTEAGLRTLLNVKSAMCVCVQLSRPASAACRTAVEQVTVRPSGRLPSRLTKPDGSLVAGIPVEAKALLTTSLGDWYLTRAFASTSKFTC